MSSIILHIATFNKVKYEVDRYQYSEIIFYSYACNYYWGDMVREPLRNVQHYKNYVLVSINPKIYPLEVVHSAAYAMMDKAYVIIDGNPEEEIFVELRPKSKKDMKDIEFKFASELLNYAVYHTQSRMNKEVRDAIIQRAFLTSAESPEPCECLPESQKDYEKIEDPLEIAKPWTPDKKRVRK